MQKKYNNYRLDVYDYFGLNFKDVANWANDRLKEDLLEASIND